MGIKNRNDRIWLAVNTETGEADYSYVHEDCNSDCEWGERARATDYRLIDGWEFRPFMIVPDTDTPEPRATEKTDGLVQDFVDVVTSMCARIYGRRSAKNRAKRALEAIDHE